MNKTARENQVLMKMEQIRSLLHEVHVLVVDGNKNGEQFDYVTTPSLNAIDSVVASAKRIQKIINQE